MIDLQRFIVSELKKIHPRIYLESAPQGATFPYVVYALPTSDENERREDFILEINIWDKPVDGSTVSLQTLSDQIDQELNRLVFIDHVNDWLARFYRINRLMIPDPDSTIRRRQLRYEIRSYRRDT